MINTISGELVLNQTNIVDVYDYFDVYKIDQDEFDEFIDFEDLDVYDELGVLPKGPFEDFEFNGHSFLNLEPKINSFVLSSNNTQEYANRIKHMQR